MNPEYIFADSFSENTLASFGRWQEGRGALKYYWQRGIRRGECLGILIFWWRHFWMSPYFLVSRVCLLWLVQTYFYWNKKFRINTSTAYTELAHWFLVWGLKKAPWLAPEKILETGVPLDCRKLIPEFLFFKGETTSHKLSYIFKS